MLHHEEVIHLRQTQHLPSLVNIQRPWTNTNITNNNTTTKHHLNTLSDPQNEAVHNVVCSQSPPDIVHKDMRGKGDPCPGISVNKQCLKLECLNVNGLKKRLNYPDFVESISNYDVFCACETHLDNTDIVNINYYVFSLNTGQSRTNMYPEE